MRGAASRHPQSQNGCLHRRSFLAGRLRASHTVSNYDRPKTGCQGPLGGGLWVDYW